MTPGTQTAPTSSIKGDSRMSPPPDDNSMAHSLFGEDSIKETAAAHLLLPLVRDPLSQSPPATIPISRSRPPTSDLHRFRHFAYCAPTLGLRLYCLVVGTNSLWRSANHIVHETNTGCKNHPSQTIARNAVFPFLRSRRVHSSSISCTLGPGVVLESIQ